ncbi:MAG: hypothetical protein KF862_15535 [Chitinophagaceae bacterium]|nr:hypothetical protein [Chitinophagaceae bacterium]
MDEVFNSLQLFQKELESFNDKLKSSFKDLHKNHEKVNPHWHDSMRNEYDMHWVSLDEKMKQYVNFEGDNYTDILIHKTSILRRYLYGN